MLNFSCTDIGGERDLKLQRHRISGGEEEERVLELAESNQNGSLERRTSKTRLKSRNSKGGRTSHNKKYKGGVKNQFAKESAGYAFKSGTLVASELEEQRVSDDNDS